MPTRTLGTIASVLLAIGGWVGCTDETSAVAYELDFHVYQRDATLPGERGAPLPGVQVAVDFGSWIEQMTTDAAGVVHVIMPSRDGEVTLTAAKEGQFPVSTIYRATVAEIEAEIALAGELYAVMEPTPTAIDQLNRALRQYVTVTATWAGPFCVSMAPYDICTFGRASQRVPRSPDPLLVYAYSVDFAGCPVELREVTLPNALTDQTVALDFDGTGRRDATFVDLTVRLPADPDSALRQMGLHQRGRFPLLIQNPAETRIIGGACNQQTSADGMAVTMRAGWFAFSGAEPNLDPMHPGAGLPARARWTVGPVEPIFDLAYFPNTPGIHNGNVLEVSFERLHGAPADGAQFTAMDTPRMLSPTRDPTLASTFSAQAVDGARMYQLAITTDQEGVPMDTVWHVRTFRHQPITVPALPRGYDLATDWPAATTGWFRLAACEHDVAEPTFFGTPAGTRCSFTSAIAGTLTR